MLESSFSNVLQIISADAISTLLFFAGGLFLEIEVTITFLYEKQFQQMTQFPKELMEM